MDLYLVRHAIAQDRDPMRWPDDGERPLTPAGERRFRKAARGLSTLVPIVDVVLSSQLNRAWHTSQILYEVAQWPAPVRFEPLEMSGPSQVVVDALAPFQNAGDVALVGHEPTLSELASYLLTGEEQSMQLELKKGGVVCLRFNGGIRPGSGTLRWWLMPKMLRALGA